MHEHHRAGGALDQGADGGLAACALDVIAFPVTWLEAIQHMRGAHADGGDVLQAREAAAAALQTAACGAALPQMRDQLGLEFGARQAIDGPVQGLVADIEWVNAAAVMKRVEGTKPTGDDLRGVTAAQALNKVLPARTAQIRTELAAGDTRTSASLIMVTAKPEGESQATLALAPDG